MLTDKKRVHSDGGGNFDRASRKFAFDEWPISASSNVGVHRRRHIIQGRQICSCTRYVFFSRSHGNVLPNRLGREGLRSLPLLWQASRARVLQAFTLITKIRTVLTRGLLVLTLRA